MRIALNPDANETVEVVAAAMRLAVLVTAGYFLRLTPAGCPDQPRTCSDASKRAYVARESDDGRRGSSWSQAAHCLSTLLASDELGDVPVRVINDLALAFCRHGALRARCLTMAPVVTFHDATPECLGDAVLRELNRLRIHAPVHTHGVEGFAREVAVGRPLLCAEV